MNDRIRTILEDYEGLLEMHEEYAESIDPSDLEIRALWDQIETDLKQLSRRVSSLQRGRAVQDGDLEDVEWQLEDLNDLYSELAALSWGDTAATS